MTISSVDGKNHDRTLVGPSAPSPGLVLFNTEDQSDIVFNVGTNDGETWRFPAHSFIVGDASPVFEHIVNSQKQANLNGSKPEIFVHCQPETFHAMLSYIYKKEVEVGCVSNALKLIPVSHQFEVDDLTRECLVTLESSVSSKNVLQIWTFLRKPECCSMEENILNQVIGKCCSILDSESEEVLRSEYLKCLEREELVEILSRDTLNCSEIVVFESLVKWANQQCLKQRRRLTCENKRDVLGKALYSARYLLMTMDQFMRGPYSTDILTDEEKLILFTKLQTKSTDLPMHLLGFKLDSPRTGSNNLPENRAHSSSQTKKDDSKMKKPVKKRFTSALSKILVCAIQILD